MSKLMVVTFKQVMVYKLVQLVGLGILVLKLKEAYFPYRQLNLAEPLIILANLFVFQPKK